MSKAWQHQVERLPEEHAGRWTVEQLYEHPDSDPQHTKQQ
jgi:hypothetical protein